MHAAFNKTSSWLYHLLTIALSSAILVLSGCSSTPPKRAYHPSSRLPAATQADIEQLRSEPLPNQLPIPVDGVNRMQLNDTWGAARSQGRRHEGIDILAPRDTAVLSTTDGVVVDTRDNALGGHVLWIAGPAGSYHYYAHLNKIKRGLDIGDKVRPGDLIGYVGNTGNARGGPTHLHYGIYLAGKGRGAVNPYPYLIGP